VHDSKRGSELARASTMVNMTVVYRPPDGLGATAEIRFTTDSALGLYGATSSDHAPFTVSLDGEH
jgi:hypothetical protein